MLFTTPYTAAAAQTQPDTRTRDGSSRKMFEPRANRAIDYRVGSSRVILRFEVRANRVKNRVKKFFFSSQNQARKIPNFLMISSE